MGNQDDGFVNVPLTINNIDRYYHRVSIRDALKESLEHLQGKLLDAGCGQMPYRAYILEHSGVTAYTGLDIETAKNYSDEVKPDVTWDGKTMPFDDNNFDCAIATEVLEHVPDTLHYLSEIHRVLKPNGTFFFTTPFLWPLHEIPHDEYRFTPYAIERLLREAGFAKNVIQPLGGWNASLAQMLGLWYKRSGLGYWQKKLLKPVVMLIYCQLIKCDRKQIGEGKMITGLAGRAHKASLSP